MSFANDWWHGDVDGIVVLDGEFVTVTREGACHPLFLPVAALLQRIHRALGLDVVFACQMAEANLIRRPAQAPTQEGAIIPEHADVLESAYCQRVLEDRTWNRRPAVPAPTRFVALPVVAKDGYDYGTVCCAVSATAADVETSREAEALFSVARLVSQALVAGGRSTQDEVWQSSAAVALEALPAGR